MDKLWGGLAAALLVVLAGCGGEAPEEAADSAPRTTLVTATEAQSRQVEVIERSLGQIISKVDPMISAEVAGRVEQVLVEVGDEVASGEVLARIDAEDYQLNLDQVRADIARLEALRQQQQRLVERYRKLVADKFFSESALDEAEAQLRGTQQQLLAARAQLGQAQRNVGRTEVRSPAAGRIDARLISSGDYVGIGTPLFQLSTSEMLQVVFPFPESLSGRLERGQPVRMRVPSAPQAEPVEAPITQLRPAIGVEGRAVEVIVDIENPGGWRPGASVDGEVVLEVRRSVVVPPVAIVRRPSGVVAYEIVDGVAQERVVRLGVQRADFVEVLEGLEAGATVAVEGASYLTDGAPVRLQEPVT